jgi:hypothetical protein
VSADSGGSGEVGAFSFVAASASSGAAVAVGEAEGGSMGRVSPEATLPAATGGFDFMMGGASAAVPVLPTGVTAEAQQSSPASVGSIYGTMPSSPEPEPEPQPELAASSTGTSIYGTQPVAGSDSAGFDDFMSGGAMAPAETSGVSADSGGSGEVGAFSFVAASASSGAAVAVGEADGFTFVPGNWGN